MLRTVSTVSFVSLFVLAAASASADPRSSVSPHAINASPGAGAPDGSGACMPSCRVGFTCIQGQCVSACNPGCADGEQCTSDGQCVPKTVAPQAAAPSSPAPIVTAPAPTPHEPDGDVAPEAPRKSGVHLHDGFYLRLSMGPSYMSSTWKGGTQDATVTGAGAALDVAVGGTPLPGFVIGGGIFSNYVSSPTLSYGGQSADTGSVSLSLFGPFVDWYPSAAQGFHMMGAAGVAYVSYNSSSGGSSVSGTGFGFMAGAGYEVWIGEQWSFGGLLGVKYATPSIKADGMTGSVDTNSFVPGILLGLTYH